MKTKAENREKKKRPKMAVHGRGIKTQPAQGIPKAAKRRVALLVCFSVFIFLCFYAITARAQSEPPPQLFIVSPAPGEVISSGNVKVKIDLPKEFILTDPKEKPEHQQGMGHLRLWLDAPTDNDKSAGIILTEMPEYTYENVFSGLHTLNAEFLRNDNTSYSPKIFAVVNFETISDKLEQTENKDLNIPVDMPETKAGLFLPRGGGNTILAIGLVFLAIMVLWYIFNWKGKKPS